MADRIPYHRSQAQGLAGDTRRRSYESTESRRADQRFYAGARWRKLRRSYLAANPLCAECRRHGRVTPAEHVHHVLERKDRPDLAYEWGNLEALCPSCHDSARSSSPVLHACTP